MIETRILTGMMPTKVQFTNKRGRYQHSITMIIDHCIQGHAFIAMIEIILQIICVDSLDNSVDTCFGG